MPRAPQTRPPSSVDALREALWLALLEQAQAAQRSPDEVFSELAAVKQSADLLGLTPFQYGFLMRCLSAGMSAQQIKKAAEKAAKMYPASSAELIKTAFLSKILPFLRNTWKPIATRLGNWFGRTAAQTAEQTGARAGAQAAAEAAAQAGAQAGAQAATAGTASQAAKWLSQPRWFNPGFALIGGIHNEDDLHSPLSFSALGSFRFDPVRALMYGFAFSPRAMRASSVAGMLKSTPWQQAAFAPASMLRGQLYGRWAGEALDLMTGMAGYDTNFSTWLGAGGAALGGMRHLGMGLQAQQHAARVAEALRQAATKNPALAAKAEQFIASRLAPGYWFNRGVAPTLQNFAAGASHANLGKIAPWLTKPLEHVEHFVQGSWAPVNWALNKMTNLGGRIASLFWRPGMPLSETAGRLVAGATLAIPTGIGLYHLPGLLGAGASAAGTALAEDAWQNLRPQIAQDAVTLMNAYLAHLGVLDPQTGQINVAPLSAQAVTGGLGSLIDPILYRLGVDPAQLTDFQKAMLVGGVLGTGAGLAGGIPGLTGVGLAAAGLGLAPTLFGRGPASAAVPSPQPQVRAPA